MWPLRSGMPWACNVLLWLNNYWWFLLPSFNESIQWMRFIGTCWLHTQRLVIAIPCQLSASLTAVYHLRHKSDKWQISHFNITVQQVNKILTWVTTSMLHCCYNIINIIVNLLRQITECGSQSHTRYRVHVFQQFRTVAFSGSKTACITHILLIYAHNDCSGSSE